MWTAALVGCGRIGFSLGLDKKREQPASHTMALNENPNIRLIAGCDTDSLNLKKWHLLNKKCVTYSNSADLYARNRVDIVTIAVNEDSHKKEAVDAIKAKPRLIILEKPVALNLNEALYIQSMAQNYNVDILVNHERRFSQDYMLAKEYMRKIGILQSIHASLYSGMPVYNPKEENTGAYSLIHDGTHLVDAVLFFLEDENGANLVDVPVYSVAKKSGGLLSRANETSKVEYKKVCSILNKPYISGVVKDEENCVRQFSAHYSTPKCPDISINMSGRSKYFGFEIEITGTMGRICIGNGYLKLYQREVSPLYTGFYSLMSDKYIKIPKRTLYFSNMVQNAVDFLDGKKPLRSTLQTGINALAVLEEMKSKLL